MAPVLVLVGVLVIYPFLYNFQLSFTNRHFLYSEYSFTGLENYLNLFQDLEFWQSFKNGLIYSGVATGATVTLGLAVALLLNHPLKGRSIAMTLVVFPYFCPTLTAALMFLWLFNDRFGIVQYFLVDVIGIVPNRFSWFGMPSTAMPACIIVSIWRFLPFAVIATLAALQMIPTEEYEAADVDGASAWSKFRHITLPHLRSVLVIVILLRFIWLFNMFDVVWLLTRGGPSGATQHLPIMVYITTFFKYNVGYATAISTVMFLFLSVFMVMYFRRMFR